MNDMTILKKTSPFSIMIENELHDDDIPTNISRGRQVTNLVKNKEFVWGY